MEGDSGAMAAVSPIFGVDECVGGSGSVVAVIGSKLRRVNRNLEVIGKPWPGEFAIDDGVIRTVSRTGKNGPVYGARRWIVQNRDVAAAVALSID